jgi:hypothetical protein
MRPLRTNRFVMLFLPLPVSVAADVCALNGSRKKARALETHKVRSSL